MSLTIVPDVIDAQSVHALRPADTAAAAASLMDQHNISAVIVCGEAGGLLGIVTERDLSRKVVAADVRGSEVELSSIMTTDPQTILPTDSPASALEKMLLMGVRHLPVVDGDAVLGVVSIRDLQNSVTRRVVSI